MSILLLMVWVFVLIFFGIMRGRKAVLLMFLAILFSLVLGLLIFLGSSNFYPCHPDECKPMAHGLITLFVAQIGFGILYYVRVKK